jgi:DNA-binding GntR family transcriptional regulator
MSLQRSFLPSPLGDEVVRADLALTPLHQVLEFKLGVIITRAHESVSAVRLGRREARDLGCGAGEPALESERVSRRRRRAGRLRSSLHPGRPLPITRELHYEGATS